MGMVTLAFERSTGPLSGSTLKAAPLMAVGGSRCQIHNGDAPASGTDGRDGGGGKWGLGFLIPPSLLVVVICFVVRILETVMVVVMLVGAFAVGDGGGGCCVQSGSGSNGGNSCGGLGGSTESGMVVVTMMGWVVCGGNVQEVEDRELGQLAHGSGSVCVCFSFWVLDLVVDGSGMMVWSGR
ncbi:extensin [Iris pallida]|uniref:Extensin n=1 Tax=Iris pallida TaxID=29817 RepID=A0AAX6GE34_IRIPA|nr:extensin [Iris pallida]